MSHPEIPPSSKLFVHREGFGDLFLRPDAIDDIPFDYPIVIDKCLPRWRPIIAACAIEEWRGIEMIHSVHRKINYAIEQQEAWRRWRDEQ